MGRRSRRKVDAVIGVALVLGLIGSEMRPDGIIVGGKSPTLLEKGDMEISSTAETGVIDQTLVEELARIKGLEENIVSDKGGVILPVLPMPVSKTAVRPDHCYSSFLGKEVKQEPGLIWQLPPAPHADPFQPVQHFPVTEVQYIPTALELLQRRVGIGGHPSSSRTADLQAELADLLAAVRPQSNSEEQSPLSFSSGAGANPEDLLNDILVENGQLAFDEPPPFSPKAGLMDPMDPGLLDPTQDIFRWMEQGAFDWESASTSQTSDLFGCAQSGSPDSYGNSGKDLPAAETDRTIDELLFALEREEKASCEPPALLTAAATPGYYQQKDPIFSEQPSRPVFPEFTPTATNSTSRKRKSDSSSSSISSKSAFDLLDHNHTYDEGAAERRGKKMSRTRSGTSDETSSSAGSNVRCRDIADFAALNVPFSYEAVVSADPSQFNGMIGDRRLNDEQRTLMRAARRRAKNRNAARQCRQRRVDEVEDLADEVEALEDERNSLIAEMDKIDADIAAQRAANERLQAFILETYRQQRPPTMRDAEYRLQSNRNGTFSLVEQRGIRA